MNPPCFITTLYLNKENLPHTKIDYRKMLPEIITVIAILTTVNETT